MTELEIRAAKRSFFQKFLTDPLEGLLVVFLWGIFKFLPVRLSTGLGAFLGRQFRHILRKKHRTALYNMHKCFPDKTDLECEKLAISMWSHFGSMVAEIPHLQTILKNVQIEGKENIDFLKNDNKGGFLCSAHLGNWEIVSPLLLSYGLPMHLVYRAANNPWVEKILFSHRGSGKAELIPKGLLGAKKMLNLLKKGEHIGMLCDQKLREGIDVPFFGYPAKTAPAIATLSLKFDVPIVPVQVIRLGCARYKCIFYKPLQILFTHDKQKDTFEIMQQINRLYEVWIKENPEQWLWIHHRWDKKEYPK